MQSDAISVKISVIKWAQRSQNGGKMANTPNCAQRSALKKSLKNWLERLAKGFLVGFVGIVPGASGSVLAVAVGLYEPMLAAITSFCRFKNMKSSFFYLLPIGIGGVAGVLGTASIVEWLMAAFPMAVMYAIMGLVLGGVTSLIREANERGGFKAKYFLGTLIGAALIIALWYIGEKMPSVHKLELTAATAALSGAILAIGTVIPGVSVSFILIYLGLFEDALAALTSFNIPMLFMMGVGFGLMALLLVFGVKKIFERYHGYSYYAMLGFLAGSSFLIFPGVADNLPKQALFIALAAAGFIATFLLCKPNRSSPKLDEPKLDSPQNQEKNGGNIDAQKK